MSIHKVYIGIGSNTDDRELRIAAAAEYLFAEVISDGCYSGTYVTEAEYGASGIYSNGVASGLTNLTESALNKLLKNYENGNGRIYNHDNKEVAIDLDLVIYDGKILRPRDFEARYFQEGYKKICE